MITEVVTFKLPAGTSREEVIANFEKTAPTWRANPDLIRKNYLFDSDDQYALIEAVDESWQGALPYSMLIAAQIAAGEATIRGFAGHAVRTPGQVLPYVTRRAATGLAMAYSINRPSCSVVYVWVKGSRAWYCGSETPIVVPLKRTCWSSLLSQVRPS